MTSTFVKDVDTAAFQREVIERSKEVPVVVDFWAAWCGPCKVLGPLLEKLAGQFEGGFELAKIDVDSNQALAGRFGVQGIPTVVGFRDGVPVSQFTGALPEPNVLQWLREIVPSEADLLVATAGDLLDEGDAAAAERRVPRSTGSRPQPCRGGDRAGIIAHRRREERRRSGTPGVAATDPGS